MCCSDPKDLSINLIHILYHAKNGAVRIQNFRTIKMKFEQAKEAFSFTYLKSFRFQFPSLRAGFKKK